MAINLTNPMSGDTFKTEIEKALDKTGDSMNEGAPLKLGKLPETDMEAVPKLYIDKFIGYLNNESPLLIQRDAAGNVMYSDEISWAMDPFVIDMGTIDYNSNFTKTYNNALVIDLSNNIFDYKAFYRYISPVFELSFSFSGSAYIKNYSGKIIFKDEDGNIIEEGDVSNWIEGNRYELKFAYFPSFDKIKNNSKIYVDIYFNFPIYGRSSNDSVNYKVSFSRISERCELKHQIQYPQILQDLSKT